MSMTKKDFEGLAAALRPAVGANLIAPLALDLLGDFLKTQNPRFDKARFVAAVKGEKAAKLAPTVYVYVESGAVSVGKPAGVAVEVVDFDTDGMGDGDLCDGHNCEVHKDHAHEVYDAASVEVL